MEAENARLKQQVKQLTERIEGLEGSDSGKPLSEEDYVEKKALTVVVFGASGDLATKKTFPSLFSLHCNGLLPEQAIIVGFARKEFSTEEYNKHVSKNFKGTDEQVKSFLDRCHYHKGNYVEGSTYQSLHKTIKKFESGSSKGPDGNRIFYMAIPPSIFLDVAQGIHDHAMADTGWSRVVIEKPFGKDLESAEVLGKSLAVLFSEQQMYRIDHYLGKEMVQNLMVLRFANAMFEPLWNRKYISNVQITFKENIGTEGRGGYFDQFGIIRDVMQNHLLQIFALVGMEPPVSLSAEHLRDEKVKLLKSTEVLKLDDVVVGQFGKSEDGSKEGYKDDSGVPEDSVTPTYAAAVLKVDNPRWAGVPFIVKCGKGLNERKTEIRIQFQKFSNLFGDVAPNELVLRVQPNEAVYVKFMAKSPGLTQDLVQTELDLTYKERYSGADIPDAYTRLIYDVIRGDHNLFVRGDELIAAWQIFTPLLHQLEKEKIEPTVYPFGSRGPPQADEMKKNVTGLSHRDDYHWEGKL